MPPRTALGGTHEACALEDPTRALEDPTHAQEEPAHTLEDQSPSCVVHIQSPWAQPCAPVWVSGGGVLPWEGSCHGIKTTQPCAAQPHVEPSRRAPQPYVEHPYVERCCGPDHMLSTSMLRCAAAASSCRGSFRRHRLLASSSLRVELPVVLQPCCGGSSVARREHTLVHAR